MIVRPVLIVVLPACQEPFLEDRHDLTDFRIAGLGVKDGDLRALVWSGEGFWHRSAPTIVWEIDGVEVIAAPPPPFTATVEIGDETGELTVETDAAVPLVTGFSREIGAEVHLAVDVEGESVTHWMAPTGEFEERGPHETTWSPAEESLTPVVALHLDGKGGNAWTLIDIPLGVSGPLLVTGGHVYPVDTPLSGKAWFAATVDADDGWAGIRLVDIAATETPLDGPCGVGGFDPAALSECRCNRDDLVGTRITLHGEIFP